MHTDPENQSPSIAVADGLSGLAIAACLLAACAGPLAGQALGEMRQPFVLASGPTGQNSDRVVIFRTPHENLPTPAFQVATGLPTTYFASSATFSGPDQVLVGDPVNEAIHVIQPSTGTRLGTRTIPFYHGGGTMAAPPSYDCVLAGSFKRFGYYNGDSEDVGRDVLHVLTPPFLSGPVKRVALGGFVSFRAHRAIDFDRKTERAFVRHTNGLAVLDPPYDRVVFNLPVESSDALGIDGNIALSPDGKVLLETHAGSGELTIFHAPFTPSSQPVKLSAASSLSSVAITPDGTKAIAVGHDEDGPSAYFISAPFGADSVVERLSLPDVSQSAFNDVDISPDGKLAVFSDQGWDSDAQLAFIEAPFTAAEATLHTVVLPNGRGLGTGVFRKSGTIFRIVVPAADHAPGDVFTAKVMIEYGGVREMTVTFEEPLLVADEPAVLDVETVAAPAPFVLSPQNSTASFDVEVVVSASGIAELQSTAKFAEKEGTVETLQAFREVLVNPLRMELQALPLIDGQPIKNLRVDEQGVVTDRDGNPVQPKIEVTLRNEGLQPVAVKLRGMGPEARDQAPMANRVTIPALFPIDLGTIAPGAEVTHEIDISIAENGRFEFAAVAEGKVGSGRPFELSARGALIIVGTDVQVKLRGPESNGLTDDSIAAGLSSIHAPLVFKTATPILETMPEVGKGLVADGVTPLLFELETPIPEGGDPANCSLSIEIIDGGTVSGPTLDSRLYSVDDNSWSSFSKVVFTGTENKQFAYLGAVTSDEVKLAGGAREVKARLLVRDWDSGAVVGEKEFFIRKPPIGLVHGYNTDGAWGDSFAGVLGGSRNRFDGTGREDFIRTIRYGQSPEQAGPTQKENTTLPFANLAPVLLGEFEEMKALVSFDWAVTRFDVVAHSQGGILTRMLCSKNANPYVALPFRNADNFNRGRFHRVVTIGSPHNGTRIVRYMIALQERLGSSSTSRVSLGIPAQVASFLIANGTAQQKFDPAGEQIALINQTAANAPWLPDPGASFHLVQTTVNSGNPPTPQAYSYADAGLGLNVVGQLVLPRGSDGVVDFDSMSATTPEAAQTRPTHAINLPATLQISHAFVDPTGAMLDLGLGVDLFGGTAGQVQATEVASHVIRALDQDPTLPAAQRAFGAFRLAAPLPAATLSAIQDAANAVTPGVANSIRAATGLVRRNTETHRFEFHLPVGEIFVGPVSWLAERYGTGGISSDGFSLLTVPGNPAQVAVEIDPAVPGDVVLYGMAATAGGKVIIGAPLKVSSVEPDASIYSASFLEVLPVGGRVPLGSRIEPEFWIVYSNPLHPDQPLRLRRWIDTEQFTVSSSESTTVDVSDPAAWLMASRGRATVTVAHGDLQTAVALRVFHPDDPDPFQSWAAAIGLPPQAQGPFDRNGPLLVQNLAAYAMGFNPFQASAADLPHLLRPGNGNMLALSYTKSKSADGVEYGIEASSDLQHWQPASLIEHHKTGETPTREIWEAHIDLRTSGSRFLRMRFGMTDP